MPAIVLDEAGKSTTGPSYDTPVQSLNSNYRSNPVVRKERDHTEQLTKKTDSQTDENRFNT